MKIFRVRYGVMYLAIVWKVGFRKTAGCTTWKVRSKGLVCAKQRDTFGEWISEFFQLHV